jgi:hypothetical protein
MRRLISLLAVLASFVFLATPLLADDFLPPDFRGDPLSYKAVWEFDTDPGPGDIWPDAVTSVGDGIHELFTAQTHTHRNTDLVFWDPQGYLYTTDLPGELAFFLNNWVDPYVYKHVWVQITYTAQGQPPCVSGLEGADESSQWSNPYIGCCVYSIEHDANHRVEYWRISPNPNMEYVYVLLPPFTTIDEVVIDTWSTDSVVDAESKSWGELKALYR